MLSSLRKFIIDLTSWDDINSPKRVPDIDELLPEDILPITEDYILLNLAKTNVATTDAV